MVLFLLLNFLTSAVLYFNFTINIPNIKNSKLIDQVEIENAIKNMNSVASKSTILGAELTSNISNTASLGLTNSVLSLNSSASVESKELQDVKNTVQKSSKQGLL